MCVRVRVTQGCAARVRVWGAAAGGLGSGRGVGAAPLPRATPLHRAADPCHPPPLRPRRSDARTRPRAGLRPLRRAAKAAAAPPARGALCAPGRPRACKLTARPLPPQAARRAARVRRGTRRRDGAAARGAHAAAAGGRRYVRVHTPIKNRVGVCAGSAGRWAAASALQAIHSCA